MINNTIGPWRRLLPAVVLLTFLLLVVFSGCRGISEEEAQHREVVAAGHASFRAYCEGCHGKNATGNGPAAEYLSIPPADLSRIALRYNGFPKDLIASRIEGKGENAVADSSHMPHWGEIWSGMNPDWTERQDVRDRIEEITAYLESIQEPSS